MMTARTTAPMTAAVKYSFERFAFFSDCPRKVPNRTMVLTNHSHVYNTIDGRNQGTSKSCKKILKIHWSDFFSEKIHFLILRFYELSDGIRLPDRE